MAVYAVAVASVFSGINKILLIQAVDGDEAVRLAYREAGWSVDDGESIMGLRAAIEDSVSEPVLLQAIIVANGDAK